MCFKDFVFRILLFHGLFEFKLIFFFIINRFFSLLLSQELFSHDLGTNSCGLVHLLSLWGLNGDTHSLGLHPLCFLGDIVLIIFSPIGKSDFVPLMLLPWRVLRRLLRILKIHLR